MSIIKTPDQRVRVFISSTINELAEERQAAREAISNLRLIPVFFEAGARPHPPRDLYSAYLEQSHIFLGIYWNSYGWIAPGAEISGLEDEYRLCGNSKPKLIYVKQSEKRDPNLDQLLQVIQDSDTACYQKFNSAEELRALIENDLSVLMSEIFETALFEQTNKSGSSVIQQILTHPKQNVVLPIIKSELIGRKEDLRQITELILKPEVSLVNILGAGGTGKTTISIHVAHQVKQQFTDGVFFIPLAPVTDSNLVAATIAHVIELQDSGKQPIQQTLTDFLIDKKMLLVLDNFEQIVEAADVVSAIISKCVEVKIIVTSRATLHIRGEYIYNLSPLSIPGDEKNLTEEAIRNFPAIDLFITRAKEVNSNLQLDTDNTNAIVEICQRLDGLPLAIELAASRTKLFQPVALLSRMGKSLDLVSRGHRDLPERQQTLRNAIEWSYNLLDEESKKVFRILGVFKRNWTIDAADAMVNKNGAGIDIEVVMEKLLDVSLIKPVLVATSSEPRFNMLQTVHEYANEILESSHEATDTKLNYADYFLEFFSDCENELWYSNAEIWLDKIEFEYQNLRAAFYIFTEHKLFEKAWKLFYLLVPYWHIRGGLGEADTWITAAKIQDLSDLGIEQQIDQVIRAKTYLWAAHVKLFLLQIEPGFHFLHLAESLFREQHDQVNLAIALAMDGGYGVYMQLPDATEKIHEAEELIKQVDNPYAQFTVTLWPSEYYRQIGQPEKVNASLDAAESIAIKYEMNSVKCYFTILRGGILTMENKWQEAAEIYLEGLANLPEKGLKDFRGGFMVGYCQCLWKTGRIEEVTKLLPPALDLVRESGQKETLFHTLMGMVEYFHTLGNLEVAFKIFGAIEMFIEITKYPLAGPSLKSHDEIKSLVDSAGIGSQEMRWMDEGKKMTLEDAIVIAVKTAKLHVTAN